MPIPVPGVKLGLANAVTLFALFYGKAGSDEEDRGTVPVSRTKQENRPPASTENGEEDRRTVPLSPLALLTETDVFNVLLCRIILGGAFTGRIVAVAYGLTGGVLGFAAQVVMKRFVSKKQIWVCGAVGAVVHNIGQIIAAMVITGTPAIIAYLPVLVIAGVFTGIITGFIAQFTIERLSKESN